MKNALRFLVVLLVALVASRGAFATCTNTVTVKDGAGVSQTFCRGTDGTNMISSVNILDSAGTNFAAVTASNALKVDGSAVTQPVSGTVTANAGTGTFNISAIPTGANTIGKVDVLGNAGAIMDFAGQNVAQPANALLTGCAFNTTPTTVTSGNATQLQCSSAARLIVDGSQVTQPVSGTVSINAIPAGSNTIGKVDVLGNAGATLDAVVGAAAAPTNGLAVLGVFNTTAPAPTNGQSAALQLSGLSNLLIEQGCAGQSVANTSVKPINNAASSNNLLLVTGVASKKVYICSINIVAAAANNVALVEGTTTTNPCDTGTAGMAGGATAATGWNFAANGGLALGSGQGVTFKEATAADNVCLFFSAANQVSGSITYAQY